MLQVSWQEAIAFACFAWYTLVVLVSALGVTQVARYHGRRSLAPPPLPPRAPSSPSSSRSSSSSPSSPLLLHSHPSPSLHPRRQNIPFQEKTNPDPAPTPDPFPPHVSIIRPVKGFEPGLHTCLESSFLLDYPPRSLSIYFCIETRSDPAYPILSRLSSEYKSRFDLHILVESDESDNTGQRYCRQEPASKDGQNPCSSSPSLSTNSTPNSKIPLGPNPKIRNVSAAYRKAKGDIIWFVDSNVWVSPSSVGEMVATLCGHRGRPKCKFVHQMPLVIDIGSPFSPFGDARFPCLKHVSGGRLEEMFMSSTHAKFYTAINTVLISPCTVGKSNMFRKSMLDQLTAGMGIDYFSHFICEDLLMGDLIWRGHLPDSFQLEGDEFSASPIPIRDVPRMKKHVLLLGDPAIQPVWGMSVRDYIARRVRWLRVRKYGVKLATFVEPGIEPFLCSLYGAWGLTSLPSLCGQVLSPTWGTFWGLWLASVSLWAVVDYFLYNRLHLVSPQQDSTPETVGYADSPVSGNHSPSFAPALKGGRQVWSHIHPWSRAHTRSFLEWLPAWIVREALALPIWLVAVYGGGEINWRGKKFFVRPDLTVQEM